MYARELDDLRERLEAISDPAGVLANIIACSTDALAVFTPEGARLFANDAFCNLFGSETAPDYDVRNDETLARIGVLFWLRRAFAGETLTTPPFWYDRKEPALRGERQRLALSARAFPVLDRNGRIQLVATAFRDQTDSMLLDERRRTEIDELRRLIDEKERADQERRDNEDQFRAIFEQCSDGVMITDSSGRVHDINPAGCQIVGRQREPMIGARFWSTAADTGRSRGLSERLMREGRISAEVRVRRADGELRELEMKSVAHFLPGLHLTTFSDVTERNRAERSLQQSQAHLMASQRIGHVGSWEFDLTSPTDLASNVLRASDECYRIFGFEPGSVQVTPNSVMSMVHPDDRVAMFDSMREAIQNRTPYSFEHRVLLADGTERFVHAQAEIVDADDSGRPMRLIGTTQDITELSRSRRQIQRLNEDLELRVAERTAELGAVNRDLEAFAYSVSHDLRAPLRAINGYAQILLDESQHHLEEDGRRSLLRIETAARRMDKLIDDLLAFSRLGRQSFTPRTVAPRAILDEALDELGVQAAGNGIEMVLGEMPECRADPGLLKQVFVNLVSNAVKFSRSRSPARIEIGCEACEGQHVWCVRDNGIGFDMEHASKLFGVFQRLPSSEAYEGTGVGLALVESIIKRHGGRIWAEAAPEKGAAFYFTL